MTTSPSKPSDILTGYVDRTTKYTKQWSKRYFTFDPSTLKLTYGKDEKSGAKGTICVTKIFRLSEQFEFKATSPDLLSINVDGTLDDGKTDQWSMRFGDLAAFTLWYETIRGAVSANGLMESMTFGLPAIDPRYNLPFATVPLENLNKFGLLEKAIIYYFGQCSSVIPASGLAAAAQVVGSIATIGQQDTYLVVGDKHLYTFRPSADVIRCFQLSSIVNVHFTPGTNFMAFQLEAPDPDMIIKNTGKTKEICDVVRRLCKVNSQGKEVPIVPITATSSDQLAESGVLRLTSESPDFKQNIASPTPKSRLKFALDMWEKKNGNKFGSSTTINSTTGSPSGGASLHSSPTGTTSSTAAAAEKARRKGGESERSPQGPPAPSAATLQSLAGKETDLSIPLVRMLHELQLAQYTVCLLSQHVDLDIITCMDDADLESFGVRYAAHRTLIMETAANGGKPVSGSSASSLARADSIALDDSLVVRAPATGASSPVKKAEVVLSDDDDDLLVLPKAPLILLDDSDDDLLPLPPGSPSALAPPVQKPTISLDDDDDI